MSAATVVSLAIGAWGATVATILGAREIKHSRRSLKVICRWGVAQHDDDTHQKVVLSGQSMKAVAPLNCTA